MESPSSATRISVKASLVDERRAVNSGDKNGGKKLRPSAKKTGLFRFGKRYTYQDLSAH